MNYRIIRPAGATRGEVVLPASKSISNRLLIMDALSGHRCVLSNLSQSEDTLVMIRALENNSRLKDIGMAGTAMRFLTAYLAVTPGTWVLTGAPRMKQRPVGALVEALCSMGAEIGYAERTGYPPLEIKGKRITGGPCSIDGSISSQFISAILMIAPCLSDGLELELRNRIVSASYIRLTLGLMQLLGIEYRWEGNVISIEPQQYKGATLVVEPDWTAASYWYAIACLSESASIRLPGLTPDSLQGDALLCRLFEGFGVHTEFRDQGASLVKAGSRCTSFEYNCRDNPDLVQTLTVLCILLGVPFRITGTETLKLKETDRIEALKNEARKLGALLESDARGSLIQWDGRRREVKQPVLIETYNDHRMAMAFAQVAWHSGEVSISDPIVVNKSYPCFWKDLERVGCRILPNA